MPQQIQSLEFVKKILVYGPMFRKITPNGPYGSAIASQNPSDYLF